MKSAMPTRHAGLLLLLSVANGKIIAGDVTDAPSTATLPAPSEAPSVPFDVSAAQGECLAARVEECHEEIAALRDELKLDTVTQMNVLRDELMAVIGRMDQRIGFLEGARNTEVPKLESDITDLNEGLEALRTTTEESLRVINDQKIPELELLVGNTLQQDIQALSDGVQENAGLISKNADCCSVAGVDIGALQDNITSLQNEDRAILSAVNANTGRITDAHANDVGYCPARIKGVGQEGVLSLQPAETIEGTIQTVGCLEGYEADNRREVLYTCKEDAVGKYVWEMNVGSPCTAVQCPPNTTGAYLTGNASDCTADRGYLIGTVAWSPPAPGSGASNSWTGKAQAVACPANTVGSYRTGNASDCTPNAGWAIGTIAFNPNFNRFVGTAARRDCPSSLPQTSPGDGIGTASNRSFEAVQDVACTDAYKGHVSWKCVAQGSRVVYMGWQRVTGFVAPFSPLGRPSFANSCARLYCSNPLAANSSRKHQSKAFSSTSIREVGDATSASCISGYTGSVRYNCVTSEKQIGTPIQNADARSAGWDYQSGSCTKRLCPQTIQATTKTVQLTFPNGNSRDREFGDRKKVGCGAGFGKLGGGIGAYTYECTANGTWVATTKSCDQCCVKSSLGAAHPCGDYTTSKACIKPGLQLPNFNPFGGGSFGKSIPYCEWKC